jgi:hypothetical protein
MNDDLLACAGPSYYGKPVLLGLGWVRFFAAKMMSLFQPRDSIRLSPKPSSFIRKQDMGSHLDRPCAARGISHSRGTIIYRIAKEHKPKRRRPGIVWIYPRSEDEDNGEIHRHLKADDRPILQSMGGVETHAQAHIFPCLRVLHKSAQSP